MCRSAFKGTVLALLVVLVAGTVGAQTVSIVSLDGQVELQAPGGDWRAAREGDAVAMASTISTGFRSEAVLDTGSARISVSPLTRMTVEELSEQQGTVTTRLSLRSGRIRADVRRAEDRTNNFQVTSPVATAAVRGTSFIFDGYRLQVLEGSVAFGGSAGDVVLVPARAESVVNGEDAAPLPPEIVAEQSSAVVVVTTPAEGGGQDIVNESPIDSADPFIPVVTAPDDTAAAEPEETDVDVNINVEWPQGF
jgi:hypothetical protein